MAQKEADLRDAAKEGKVDIVNKLLEEEVAQTPDESGDTPLLLATTCYLTQPQYVEVVRSLLEHGADVNHKNKSGNAAIHNTASKGNLETMELLLDNGADYQTEGEAGIVPLGLAATKKHHGVVNVLVKRLNEDKQFSPKQVEWMNNVANDGQQTQIYRALSAIFKDRTALAGFIKLGVIESILKGMEKYTKISIQTSGLQLLATVLFNSDGLELAKKTGLKEKLMKACSENSGDAVVTHLLNEVTKRL